MNFIDEEEPLLTPQWVPNANYRVGDCVSMLNENYKFIYTCLWDHTSNQSSPSNASPYWFCTSVMKRNQRKVRSYEQDIY